ncbi:hypothetical protein [Micromonospora sp. NPDC092111]|uniref:hypothetical protein n=1 Tax=Micromonospora sp. NPDC092111 TaxID=3364289 RepID=UPI003825A5E3
MSTEDPARQGVPGDADRAVDFRDADRAVDFRDADRAVDLGDADRAVDLRDDFVVLPEQTVDDTDFGWGEHRGGNDDWLLAERPPHWG